jgi:hypothetical protein
MESHIIAGIEWNKRIEKASPPTQTVSIPKATPNNCTTMLDSATPFPNKVHKQSINQESQVDELHDPEFA